MSISTHRCEIVANDFDLVDRYPIFRDFKRVYHGQTGERPDGATLIPWTRGKPLAWDIIIANTYANSYVDDMATREAADQAVPTKTTEYTELSKTHHFTPIVIEMGGSWNYLDIEFVTELGRRITAVTQEP